MEGERGRRLMDEETVIFVLLLIWAFKKLCCDISSTYLRRHLCFYDDTGRILSGETPFNGKVKAVAGAVSDALDMLQIPFPAGNIKQITRG